MTSTNTTAATATTTTATTTAPSVDAYTTRAVRAV